MSEATVPEDTEYEFPTLRVGDHVIDREDDDATLLVVGIPGKLAREYEIEGDTTLAQYNSEYPDHDEVIECVYPQRTHNAIPDQQYGFPRTRLRLETPVHDAEKGGDA